MIKVLWGVFKDNKSWQEEILSEKEENFEAIKNYTSKLGYHSFRIGIINFDDCLNEDFKKTINI